MNTQQATVTHLLDPEWIVVVQEQMDIYGPTVGLVVEPALCGQYDAEQGLPCEPLRRGYTRLGDIEAYTIAYQDTTALWARMVDEANHAIDAEAADHLADTEEYQEYLYDCESWRYGFN